MERPSPVPVTDDGWPYSDFDEAPSAEDEVDLDLLELRADPHAFSGLTDAERSAVALRCGLDDRQPRPMKEVARIMGLSHAEARDCYSAGIEKLRRHFAA